MEKDGAIRSYEGELPMGADKMKKNKTRRKKLHTHLRLGSCPVLHTAMKGPSGRLAVTEHVLRGDGQDLASSCSYHSLLALLLLPCSELITTDKGHTGICRHKWIERVVLTCLPLENEHRWKEDWLGNKDFKNIKINISAKNAVSLFWVMQNFYKLMGFGLYKPDIWELLS